MQSDFYILQRERGFLTSSTNLYKKYLSNLRSATNIDNDTGDTSKQQLVEQIEKLNERLLNIKSKHIAINQRRTEIAKKLLERRKLKELVMEKLNNLSLEKSLLTDRLESVNLESTNVALKLQRYMQMNAFNDAFFIWYNGPFATINNFRLGNIPARPVEWNEINAALGQAVLAVNIVASRASYEFKKYLLLPMGSFPKVCKSDDRRTVFYLYIDGSFSFFPKRNFNLALTGFVSCVYEMGEYVKKHDPTLCLPYNIAITSADVTVHGLNLLLGKDDDEAWTKALKFLLSDVKWIIAWYTKHCNSFSQNMSGQKQSH